MSLGITIPNRNTVFVFLSACIKLLLKAGVAQLVERQPSKLKVAGSSLVSRSLNSDKRNITLTGGAPQTFWQMLKR